MKTSILIVVALVLSCRTSATSIAIDATRKIGIVADFEPALFGQKVDSGAAPAELKALSEAGSRLNSPVMENARGIFLSLGNAGWIGGTSDLDINRTILQAAQGCLMDGVTVADLRATGLTGKASPLGTRRMSAESVLGREQLRLLGRKMGADLVVLVHSAVADDWIQNSGQSLYGAGHYVSRNGEGVYCVLACSLFDCRTEIFEDGPVVTLAKKPVGVSWHGSWEAYPAAERRALSHELEIVLKESVPLLLGRLGLANPVKPLGAGAALLSSFVPEGSEIEIPGWVAPSQAKEAVRTAFARLNWIVTQEKEECLIADRRRGSKDAICTVAISGDRLALQWQGYRLDEDGRRAAAANYDDWRENLKTELVTELMQAEESPAK